MAGSRCMEEGHKMGQGSRGPSFEDLEVQAGLTAFPFPFPQSSQIQTGYSLTADFTAMRAEQGQEVWPEELDLRASGPGWEDVLHGSSLGCVGV